MENSNDVMLGVIFLAVNRSDKKLTSKGEFKVLIMFAFFEILPFIFLIYI